MKKMNTTRNLLAAIAIAVAMFAANLEAKAAVTDISIYVVTVDLKAMTISIVDKEAAGIKGIAASKSTKADAYYSLSGARVSKTTKGIVFHNGKKIVNSF